MKDDLILQVNGEKQAVPPSTNVIGLLDLLAVKQDRIAVEINRRIIKKTDWQTTLLSDGDKVEIVQFVGGG